MSNELDAFEGIPLVDLTAPDGTVYHFRYGAMIPYAGEEYAVLLEMEANEDGEEQILVTRVEKAEDGNLSFVVAEEPDVIQAVFDKYVKLSVEAGLEDEADAE
ncbi:MAG: DUF1292 domain-containing protein [Clostridia bacterium]|nr:DUF1292 domain-containing protein [Clostridia bacterium]